MPGVYVKQCSVVREMQICAKCAEKSQNRPHPPPLLSPPPPRLQTPNIESTTATPRLFRFLFTSPASQDNASPTWVTGEDSHVIHTYAHSPFQIKVQLGLHTTAVHNLIICVVGIGSTTWSACTTTRVTPPSTIPSSSSTGPLHLPSHLKYKCVGRQIDSVNSPYGPI